MDDALRGGAVESGSAADNAQAAEHADRLESGPPRDVPAAASERTTKKKPKAKRRTRTDLCVHRRKPDEFCSRCDA